MKIVVAGGSGFVGEPLVERLAGRGDVVVLSRNPAKVRVGRGVAWHPPGQGPWSAELADADVIVNLAGENIGEVRWTEERKRRVIASRIDATSALTEALRAAPTKPRTLVNASAVGYYGARHDDVELDERDPRGPGFLADVVEQWEAAAREAEPLARLVILRFGVVLEKDGGALAKMLTPFRLGAGGPIGNGKQWMSWIDREDALRTVEWAIDHASAQGIYNATAPHPVRNREFARELGSALHRPAVIPAPAFALRLAFGEMADEMLLAGQRVVPARAIAEGFEFRYPTLGESLRHVLA